MGDSRRIPRATFPHFQKSRGQPAGVPPIASIGGHSARVADVLLTRELRY